MIGLIFNIDGTLVDNGVARMESWRRAFAARGLDVPRRDIQQQIGKPDALLIASLIGEEAARAMGTQIAEQAQSEYCEIARQVHFPLRAGTLSLLREMRRRQMPRAAVSFSTLPVLSATQRSAGLDLGAWFSVVVTADANAKESDLPILPATASRLGVECKHVYIVGEFPLDGERARAHGMGFVGMAYGGGRPQLLREAGARLILRDPGALAEMLDEILAGPIGTVSAAAPGT